MAIYPLKFKPILIEKIWGGANLNQQFPQKNSPQSNHSLPIGESWELADLPQAESTITNGPHAGRTLHQLIQKLGAKLLGDLRLTLDGRFPLLLKFLDTSQPLSIQVHPPTSYLKQTNTPNALPKHEAWYIIAAEPNAVIYRGIKPEITLEQFQNHLQAGTAQDALVKHPAKPGRCYYIPAGTVHAVGPGILLAEVQLPSDTTYRLYDWQRTDRALHLEQGIASIEPTDPVIIREIEKRSHIAGVFTAISKICDAPDFRIEKVRMAEGYEQDLPYNQPAAWMVLEGQATITKTPANIDVEVNAGDTILIPAGMQDAHINFQRNTTWLEIQFPTPLENQRLA